MKKTLYIVMGFFGLALTTFAAFALSADEILKNILISLGCGIITSTLVSFLIEHSNWRIERERSRKMKKNILNDLLEIIKKYCDEDFDFIKIEQFIKSDLLSEISSSCEIYIPMGIQFYDDEELKTLKSLYYSSKSLLELMQKESTRELHSKYERVFLKAVNWNFEHGPYSEEDKIKEMCKILKLALSNKEACQIGETVFLYKKQNFEFKESLEKFKYLLEPEKEHC